MSRNRFRPEEIVGLLREVDTGLNRGLPLKQICRKLDMSPQTYYRWRCEYGGMKVSQANRLKVLEKENTRLKRAVAELTLDKLVLKEALEGNS